jgi:hypothetical protein
MPVGAAPDPPLTSKRRGNVLNLTCQVLTRPCSKQLHLRPGFFKRVTRDLLLKRFTREYR